MQKKISIIGSGFSSLAAACYLSQAGHMVTVYEKNATVGGRARQLKRDGFTFDMGPSWYWMPDIFDSFFGDFGKKNFGLLSTGQARSRLQNLLFGRYDYYWRLHGKDMR